MHKRNTRLDCLRRLIQAIGVALRLLAKAAYRRLRGIPAGGPQLVRQGLEDLGGAFIKFGQVLSLQVELFPKEYCDALLALLDLIPSFSRRQVEQIFMEELGTLPEHCFSEFIYPPIAAASIGQVHRAVLKNGTPVAVKVQRPDIDYVFERDCLLLEGFVDLIVLLRIRSLYFLRESVLELSSWTRDELDYRREASFCEFLGRNAANVATERIPIVYWEFTTTKLLTIEFLEGPSVAQYFRLTENRAARDNDDRLMALTAGGFVPADFTSNIITNFLRDAFLCGAFHADLHPANLLILPGNVVGYVDFGIVAFLTQDTRRKMVRLILAYASGDMPAIYECLLEVCTLEEGADLAAVRRKIQEKAPEWYEQPAIAGRVRFRVSVTKAFLDLFAICREHGVFLDRAMVRFIRSIFYVDGLVARLASGTDLAGKLRQAVELWQTNEARRSVSSPGTVLSLLTDAVLWAQAGPGGLLRSLEALDRRRFQYAAKAESGTTRNLRLQTVAVAAVWVFLALAFALGGFFPSFREAPILAALTLLFVLAWTAWLIHFVRRMRVD